MTVVSLDTRRRDTLGGSDAAAACGVNPHHSRVMLWAEKTGRITRPETEAMRWGKLLEPVVFAELEARSFDVMPAPADEWRSDALPWLTGHPDGFVALDGERALLEIKTGGVWTGHDWKADAGAPIPYLVQVHHYMVLTDTERALLACLIGGQRLELRVVHRSDDVARMMLERERAFLDYVRTDTPPPPDGSDSAREAIRELYPDGNGGAVHLSKAQWQTVLEARALSEQLATVKRQLAERTQAIQLAMGDAERAISPFDTPVARWTHVDSTRLDTSALKAARPDVYQEFAVSKPTRRFTLE